MSKFATQTVEEQTPISTCGEGSESTSRLSKAAKQTAPTRILFLADSFSPHAGGSREYYYNLYRELVASGAAKVVILTKKVPGWKAFDAKHSSPSFRIHRRLKPLKSWKYMELPKGIFPFFQTVWQILRVRPDVIHAGDLYPQGLIAWIVSRLSGIPYVMYAHGEEITQTDHYRYQPYIRDRIYRGAAAVVANSEFTKEHLLRIGVGETRIEKVTPGVDAVRFRPEPPAKTLMARYNLAGKVVILTVGRLVPRKGHRAALEAFASVCQEFPEAHYLIAGSGPEEDKLQSLSRELGLQDRVTFAGLVSTESLPDIYNLCEVMLLANRHEKDGDVEGFGMVFLEANAARKPVIGGRSGGAIEAVADGITGLLVDAHDPHELASALRELLTNHELRQRMGAAGRSRVESEFDWTARARKLHKVNCRVLNQLPRDGFRK